MSDPREMEAAIEAVLFVSSEPVPRARLVGMFEEDEREQAAAALDAVLARYAAGEGRGVMVEDVAGGVRLVTRPEMGVWLRRFFDVASAGKLSMAALETLAIVAYRQPITGPEIQELRSVSPSGVLKTLLEKRLVRIAGRKEVVGKPFLYATTREFLVHFGLNSLRDLPPLEEFEETFGVSTGGALGTAGTADPASNASPELLAEEAAELLAQEAADLLAGEAAERREGGGPAERGVEGEPEGHGAGAEVHEAGELDAGRTGGDGSARHGAAAGEAGAGGSEITAGVPAERGEVVLRGLGRGNTSSAGTDPGELEASGLSDAEDSEERFLREVAELEDREEAGDVEPADELAEAMSGEALADAMSQEPAEAMSDEAPATAGSEVKR